MKGKKLLYYIVNFMITVITCFLVAFLIKLVHFNPETNNIQYYLRHILTGVPGLFLYILPLFIICFFPLSVRLKQIFTQDVFLQSKDAVSLCISGVGLSFVFIFVIREQFDFFLFMIYSLIGIISYFIYYSLNYLVMKLFTVKL
jgi:hypothetical protein